MQFLLSGLAWSNAARAVTEQVTSVLLSRSFAALGHALTDPRHSSKLDHRATFSHEIALIGPPLHELHPFSPERRASISATNLVLVPMRELAFDRIGVPLPRFICEARKRGSEAVRTDLVLVEAKPTQCGVERAIADRAFSNAITGEQQRRLARQTMEIAEDINGLPRQW